jgi:hypothetical protein
VLAVLLVLVETAFVDRVCDRGHKIGGAFAELACQDRDDGMPGAAVCDVLRVDFDGVASWFPG